VIAIALAAVVFQGETTWVERSRLPHSGRPRDEYGSAVAVDGDTLLVADPAPLGAAGGDGKGAVFVFRGAGHEWREEAVLVPADLAVADNYGASVALRGDTAVVGAWADDDGGNATGSVYVFERSGTTWVEAAKLHASDPGEIHRFGWSLAFDGETIVVGADGVNLAEGAAYVFVRQGPGWIEQAKLLPESWVGTYPVFGDAVAIDGERALVGAPGDQEGGADAGAAYVFRRSGTSWAQEAKLVPPAGAATHWAGKAVALAGDVAVVGEHAGAATASALVYRRVNGAWTFERDLVPEPPATLFGRALSSEPGTLVCGAPSGEGWVYVFEHGPQGWSQAPRLVASDAHAANGFGTAVAVRGGRLAVGARGLSDSYDPGMGYVLDRVPFPGERFCFGDGSGNACPCANEDSGERGCRNGTGRGAGLDGSGSNSAGADDLALSSFHLPPREPGFFLLGTDPAGGGGGLPAYDGLACLGGTILRGPVFESGAGGSTHLVGPLAKIPGARELVEPGRTLYFQAFYRDPLASPCGARANFSSAYAVTYAP